MTTCQRGVRRASFDDYRRCSQKRWTVCLPLPSCDKDDGAAPSIQIDENGHVAMPTPVGGLIQTECLEPAEVHVFHSRSHVVINDAPETFARRANKGGDGGHGISLVKAMTFPAQHRVKLHSTNPLERLNKEVKRRADVVGIFPNEQSIIRLIGAILLEQNDEWQLQSRYMQVEAMAELNHQPNEAQPAQIPPRAA